MKKICLRSAGASRHKYIGSVEPEGVLPFRISVGPNEVFEFCHPDGSPRDGALHHGLVVALSQSGLFVDPELKLSDRPCCFVIEKLDAMEGRIRNGDRISLRTSNGWLASGCGRLAIKDSADWSEAAFQIFEIPGFAENNPLTLSHCGKPVESLNLGPHGRAAGGEARIHVALDGTAPPGGILVSFRSDSTRDHVYIPPILLDGVSEGFSPIHFSRPERIPESGIDLTLSAEIPCSGEYSADSAALSVFRLDHFEQHPSSQIERNRGDRRMHERRSHERRIRDRRAESTSFDNHFLETGIRRGILYS